MPPFECTWDAGAAILEHQIRVVANLAAAAASCGTIRTKGLGYAEKVDVDVVQVTATVVDGRGHYVKGLPQSVFHVFEDDRPQTITHFASEDVPLELIVAVDISGSMAPAMPKLKKAVKEFLGAVPPDDQVTLLGFNDTVFALTRAATSPADRVKAVDRLAAWGGTALYDVILRGVDMLGRAGRTQGDRRLHRWRGRGQPRGVDRRRATAAGERRHAVHDRAGPRRDARAAEEGHGAAVPADRRTRAVHRQHRRAARARSTICSTSCRSSICSDTRRPTTSATMRSGASR